MTKLEREFDISRDPEDYSPTIHYEEAKRNRTMVEDDVVTEAIEEGEVVKVDEGGTSATLRHDWLMATFEVVIGVNDRKIQTAYEVD